MKLSRRLDQFPEYIFSRLGKKVADVEKASGKKVLSFGAGSPDFPPSKYHIDKLNEFFHQPGSHMYPPYDAIAEFTKGLQDWYKKRFAVALASDELFPLLGAKEGIAHLPLALLDDGDEFLVPDPGYPGFSGPAIAVGAQPVYYNLTKENNFTVQIAELEQKISSKTRFLWVNFPSNPTGQVASRSDLKLIVQFAKTHQIWVIYDNAYSEITFGGYVAPSILQVEGAKDVAVEIGSFSKTFSFAGFRMGWIVGNRDVIEALAKIKSQFDSGMSLSLQQLGAFALTHDDTAWRRSMINNYNNRRNVIASHLRKLGLEFTLPKGSLYIWAKIPSSFRNSEEFSNHVLEKKHVLLTPGTAFGANGKRYVRVSICVNIDRIDEYF